MSSHLNLEVFNTHLPSYSEAKPIGSDEVLVTLDRYIEEPLKQIEAARKALHSPSLNVRKRTSFDRIGSHAGDMRKYSDGLTANGQKAVGRKCLSRAQMAEPYELSQDLLDKQNQVLSNKYGGPDIANSAANTIQRAYRRYSMGKKFAAITSAAHTRSENRLSRRFAATNSVTCGGVSVGQNGEAATTTVMSVCGEVAGGDGGPSHQRASCCIFTSSAHSASYPGLCQLGPSYTNSHLSDSRLPSSSASSGTAQALSIYVSSNYVGDPVVLQHNVLHNQQSQRTCHTDTCPYREGPGLGSSSSASNSSCSSTASLATPSWPAHVISETGASSNNSQQDASTADGDDGDGDHSDAEMKSFPIDYLPDQRLNLGNISLAKGQHHGISGGVGSHHQHQQLPASAYNRQLSTGRVSGPSHAHCVNCGSGQALPSPHSHHGIMSGGLRPSPSNSSSSSSAGSRSSRRAPDVPKRTVSRLTSLDVGESSELYPARQTDPMVGHMLSQQVMLQQQQQQQAGPGHHHHHHHHHMHYHHQHHHAGGMVGAGPALMSGGRFSEPQSRSGSNQSSPRIGSGQPGAELHHHHHHGKGDLHKLSVGGAGNTNLINNNNSSGSSLSAGQHPAKADLQRIQSTGSNSGSPAVGLTAAGTRDQNKNYRSAGGVSTVAIDGGASSPGMVAIGVGRTPTGKEFYHSNNYAVNEVIRKRHYRTGLNIFNKKPEKGILYLISKGFLDNSPAAVARFLITRKGLSKQMIGEYLGNISQPFNQAVLTSFANEMDLSSMQIDVALRKFQTYFRMPGEAQKIERLMEVFSQRYCYCNPNIVSKLNSTDTIFVLAFAIILLNTDLHTPNLKPEKRMKADDFIRNLRGIDDGCDVDRDMLLGIYERIRAQEFKPGSDHVTQVMKVQQTIVSKCPNLAVPYRRLVCYCRLYEVQDKNKKDRPGQHQREVFLFNDILVITKIHSRRKNSVTYTFRNSFPLTGMLVSLFENSIYSHGITLTQRWDKKVVITLNARNDHDRSKFVEDLRESIAEMDEMETLRIEAELEKQHVVSRVQPSQESPNTQQNDGKTARVRSGLSSESSTNLKRSAINNSLLDLVDGSHHTNISYHHQYGNHDKPVRGGSVGSLDSGMSVSFQSGSAGSAGTVSQESSPQQQQFSATNKTSGIMAHQLAAPRPRNMAANNMSTNL